MNSVATKDNSIATENIKTMRQVKTMCLRQSFLCCDRHSSVCQDQGKFYVTTQHLEPGMGDKKTSSQQSSFMSRQTQHEAEVNFVAIKTNIVAT